MNHDDEKSTLFLALRALLVTVLVLTCLTGLKHLGLTSQNINAAAEQAANVLPGI